MWMRQLPSQPGLWTITPRPRYRSSLVQAEKPDRAEGQRLGPHLLSNMCAATQSNILAHLPARTGKCSRQQTNVVHASCNLPCCAAAANALLSLCLPSLRQPSLEHPQLCVASSNREAGAVCHGQCALYGAQATPHPVDRSDSASLACLQTEGNQFVLRVTGQGLTAHDHIRTRQGLQSSRCMPAD